MSDPYNPNNLNAVEADAARWKYGYGAGRSLSGSEEYELKYGSKSTAASTNSPPLRLGKSSGSERRNGPMPGNDVPPVPEQSIAASPVVPVPPLPWLALLSGTIVGVVTGVLPFAIRANFYHSPYVDKVCLSMALLCSGFFYAIARLRQRQAIKAGAGFALSFVLAQCLWLPTGRFFPQIYLQLLTTALNHIGR